MTDTVLEIKRTFDAPMERVFDAWMEQSQWQAWIGPEGTKSEVPEMEPRVGGRYKIVMNLSDGRTMPIVGTFKIVERPARIAFTWALETHPHDSLVTITLRDAGGGRTELTLRHDNMVNAENRDAHGRGWNSALNKLEAYLK
jgi:uncharacterized protein YndB with AHSA1/START domain